MKSIRTIFVLSICIISMLAACTAPRNLIVLMPDPDGKTGKIEVSNKGGSQIISEAYKASEVQSFTDAPKAPTAIEESTIRDIFRDALAAQPPAPVHYLLYFKSNTTKLTEESLKTFEDVCATVKRIKPSEVSIVGHTDRVGTRENNFHLGFERAKLIQKLLISKGIDPNMISIASHGEDNPLVKTEDEVPEPRNRRVEIIMR